MVGVNGPPASGGVRQEYAGWVPVGGQTVLVQLIVTGNGDLGPTQVEKLLAAAVAAANG